MSYVDHAHRHLPGGTDPLQTGIPPFIYKGVPDVIVSTGDDPDVVGALRLSYKRGGLGVGDVVLGIMSIQIDGSPGTTGTGVGLDSGGYEVDIDAYPGMDTWSLIGGSGVTSPGGVPYVVVPEVSGTLARLQFVCPNVVDPDAATFNNVVRPDFPDVFVDGDRIFYGHFIYMVGVPT